jgi:hypothetical protein
MRSNPSDLASTSGRYSTKSVTSRRGFAKYPSQLDGIRVNGYTYTYNLFGASMPQVTLYLDEDTVRLLRERASAAGMPYSRWVAQLIRNQADADWPADLAALFGAHPDMPLAEALRDTDAPDRSPVQW